MQAIERRDLLRFLVPDEVLLKEPQLSQGDGEADLRERIHRFLGAREWGE